MSEDQNQPGIQQSHKLFSDLQQYAAIQYAASDLGQQSHLMALRNTIAYAALQVQNDPSISEENKTSEMMTALTTVIIGDTKNQPSGLFSELGTASRDANRSEGDYHVRSAQGYKEPNLLNFAGDSGLAPQYHDEGKVGFQTQHALAGVMTGYHTQRLGGYDSSVDTGTFVGMATRMSELLVGDVAAGSASTVLHYTERLRGTKSDAKLYDVSVPVGAALAAGNIHRLQLGDRLMLAAGDEQHKALAQQALGRLAQASPSEVSRALASNASFSLTERPTIGKPLIDVLPDNFQSMLGGSDELGSRNDIDHITVGPSGIPAGQNLNDLRLISAQADSAPSKGRPHLLILEDGTVQGPESGGVPYDQNAPFDRRGYKGDGLAVMYAGKSSPNPLQMQTLSELQAWLQAERSAVGYTGTVRIEGNNPEADQLLHLRPTSQVTMQPPRPQVQSPGMGP